MLVFGAVLAAMAGLNSASGPRVLAATPEIVFGVQGFGIQEEFDDTGRVLPVVRIDFSSLVSSPKYFIGTTKLNNLRSHEVAVIETGSDGTDTFSIVLDSSSQPALEWVSSDLFPNHLIVHEDAVWLAYCSWMYLDRASAGCPIDNPYLLDDYPVSKVRVSLERKDAVPRVVSKIQIVSPDYYYEPGTQPPLKRPLPSPYEHGYRISDFSVLAYTNVNGLEVPSEFVVQKYSQKREAAASADDLVLRLRLRCVVTNVTSSVHPDQLVPTLTHPIPAWDFRFHDSVREVFDYPVKNSLLLSKSDPVVLDGLNRKIQEIQRRKGAGDRMLPAKKGWILVLFVAACAFPALLIWRGKLKIGNEHTNP